VRHHRKSPFTVLQAPSSDPFDPIAEQKNPMSDPIDPSSHRIDLFTHPFSPITDQKGPMSDQIDASSDQKAPSSEKRSGPPHFGSGGAARQSHSESVAALPFLLVACWKRTLKESATACAPGIPSLAARLAEL